MHYSVVEYGKFHGHPLQALADANHICRKTKQRTTKVVLSWAPHPKALPHAVGQFVY